MLPRFTKLLFAGILGILSAAIGLTEAPAQQPAQPDAPPAVDMNGPEVLARGPVHEAFATTVEEPKPGEIAPKAPPEPVEELPPDQKPEGDNVQWIPGYWDWDEDRTDFIWVSGFWRVPPPNHVWVPGSWRQVSNGWQWTSGFWAKSVPHQPQPEIEYLPQPPQPVELGPSIPAPDATSVYVTGSWVWRGRYVWRPGFWMAYRPGWIWVPAHFRWTPLGYVFIDGYWDYPVGSRGVLFTPVYFPQRVLVANYVYTPTYVVAEPVLFGALFVRRGYSSYYFGDYYDQRSARFGYQPWCAPALRGSVAVVPARGFYYDPLWNYYSVSYRRTPQWSTNVTNLYVGRYDGTVARPPHTLAQQNQVIQKVTNVTNVNNVTNNITVVNNAITVNNKDVSQHVMVAPLAVAPKLQTETKLQPITQQVRQAEAKHAVEIRHAGVVRQKAEQEALKSRPIAQPTPGAPTPPPQPVKVKIDVPKAAVVKSQVHNEKLQPPPAPVHPPVQPKVEPKIAPKVDPPKIDPKMPPVVPPKVEPKMPPVVPPKIEPPKVEPKMPPVAPPKVEPPRPVPPKVEPPKVEPRPVPKFEPPKVEPRPAVPPKVEPRPVVPPKVEPPRPVVPPKVEQPRPMVPPKVEPPKNPNPEPKDADPKKGRGRR